MIDRYVAKAVASLDEKFSEATINMNWESQHFYLEIDRSVTEAIDAGFIRPQFATAINHGIAKFYHHQNSLEATRKINSLSGDQKRLAINRLEKLYAHSFSMQVRLPKSKDMLRAKAALEAVPAKRRAKSVLQPCPRNSPS